MNGGRRALNSGFPKRLEFSVVVVTGSSFSLSSEGSSVTKVVSKSSGSGVVCVACPFDLSSVADGRIRLRLIDGRMELDGARLPIARELRRAGRLAPRDEVGIIFGDREVREGRMLEVGWILARTLVGLTKERRELPPKVALDEELGLKADTDPLDRRGPENRRLEASAVFTAVALIVGMISLGVMIAGPFVELFRLGLKVGRERELPKGRMTGVNPFFFGNFDLSSSSSSSSSFVDDSLIEPSSTAGVGFINCDDGEMPLEIAAVGSIFTRLSTADGSIGFAKMMLDVLSMT